MNRIHTVIAATIIALFACTQALAGTVKLDFSVDWRWRYSLHDQTISYFQSFTTPLVVMVDTTLVDRVFFPNYTTINFGSVVFQSDFSSLIDMGVNVASGNSHPSYSFSHVQDTYVTDTNQGTWTMLAQGSQTPVGLYYQWMQYNDDPRLVSPATFGTDDFIALLKSHVGDSFGYREDIFWGSQASAGGWQNLGEATLLSVSSVGAVPDSIDTFGLVALSLGSLAILSRRRVS